MCTFRAAPVHLGHWLAQPLLESAMERLGAHVHFGSPLVTCQLDDPEAVRNSALQHEDFTVGHLTN